MKALAGCMHDPNRLYRPWKARIIGMDGGVLALQLRDILPDGLIAANGLIRIQVGDISERYLARTGDVVFRSRGERNTAAVVDESISEPALAVLPLMILRPNPQLLSGAYLAWAINQEPAQRKFEEEAPGL